MIYDLIRRALIVTLIALSAILLYPDVSVLARQFDCRVLHIVSCPIPWTFTTVPDPKDT